MNSYIGLDIGTSAVKGALICEDGRVLAVCSEEFEYYNKLEGKLMQPQYFVDACRKVINHLAQSSGDSCVRTICPCCASGNLILLDENNQPLTPIIGWQSKVDTEDFKRYYTKEELDEIYSLCGWGAGASFPIAYLPWLKENKKELFEKTQMFCMSAEYLNFVFTGKWGISHSMGTPFYLMNQEKGCYNAKLLKKLGIDEKKLPPIYDKGTVLGTVLPNSGLNVPSHTKVVLGSFDHPSGATGAGVYNCGEMLLSCGTSWVEFFPVETREKAMNAGFLTDRYMLDGAPYCVMTSLESVSIKIDRIREHYFGKISHREFDEYAALAKKGCNGLEFDFTESDFLKGEGFEKCDIARAITEAAAKLLKKNLDEVKKKGLLADKITMIGGISNSDTCVKIIAQILEQDIHVVNGVSAGAVGAAMLAAIGAGTFKNERDAYSNMHFEVKTIKYK